jgi:aminoglycoside phosphotransferase family enzyme/predicted kinase
VWHAVRASEVKTEELRRLGLRSAHVADGEDRALVGDRALVRALADPATYPGRPEVRVHETHASWVFVAGERVYKVKKPVALDFLDYSTLSRRLWACREEVRVNEELAPDVYVGVRAIAKTEHGVRIVREAAREAVEYAVEMRRFREQDTLEGVIAEGALTLGDVRAVASRIERFHRSAALVSGGGPRDVLERWRSNVRGLERLQRARGWRLDVMNGFGEAFVRAHAREIERRVREGLVRDCHGDLRCEHVLVRPNVRIVDRIEFDPAVRRIDVAGDLAFLAMDLEDHGPSWAAPELVSAYRHRGGDPGSDALRAFYGAHWSLVRAKVALIANSGDAQPHWELAERLCWRARRPLAILVCGPPASGKSVLAAELSRRSGIAVVCTDEVRKRRAGIAPTERARPEHYRESFTRAVYEQVGREALMRMHAHQGVIVDASCGSQAHRALLLRRLERVGSLRVVVRCDVALDVAMRRAARRMEETGRVSDATPELVAELYRSFEPLEELPADSVLTLSTELALDSQVAEVARAVDQRLDRRGLPLGGGSVQR